MSGVTDPIADMLTRIRNAVAVRHLSVIIPASKIKVSIARLLKEEGFVRDFEVLRGQPQRILRIHLSYTDRRESAIKGLRRVSSPGLRVYVGKGDIPRAFGGIGVAILSTSQGVLSAQEAWRLHVGGELLCNIW
jgi:small subunit ribosomal protein S8